MNKEIIQELKDLKQGVGWGLEDRLDKLIAKLESGWTPEEKKKQRTWTQNKAIWKFFSLLAESLNAGGIGQRAVFEKTEHFDVPNTKDSIHDLWIYFQYKMFRTNKTRDLKKIAQIDKVHEVVMKNMGEIFEIEYIEFPHENKPNQHFASRDLAKENAKLDVEDYQGDVKGF